MTLPLGVKKAKSRQIIGWIDKQPHIGRQIDVIMVIRKMYTNISGYLNYLWLFLLTKFTPHCIITSYEVP